MVKKIALPIEQLLFRLAVIALIGLASVVFMGKSYEKSLQAMDSSSHARYALDVTSQGLKPVLPIRSLVGGHDREIFNDHPFTLFYVVGWVMRIFGADAWSARLLPSFFALACVPATLWLTTLLFTPTVGLAAAFVLTLSLPFISYGARFQLDPAMIFFIILSFVAWIKRRPVWMGVAAGLGIWMKNPVALLVFPAALLSLALSSRVTMKELKRIAIGAFIALGLGAVIWIIAGSIGGWDLIWDYWHRQVFGTAVRGRDYSQPYDPFLFIAALRRRYWPWLPLLIVSIALIIKNRKWKDEKVALPLSATLVVIIAISAMRFKFDHYYFPMYPFLAIISVDCLRSWLAKHEMGIKTFIITSGLILPAFLLATPIELSPEMFPALSHFEAMIQSYGSCTDKVMFIDGDQPYASYEDYEAELAFYTNRPSFGTDCAHAAKLSATEKPQWIIVSASNRTSCLDKRQIAEYPTVFQFGNQYLLSRHSRPGGILDLTPLARELRAPLDCAPVPLPKDRYHRYEEAVRLTRN